MKIESGSTDDRRNRLLIYVALLLLFTGWFGYDGFVSYPGKNVKWARQNLATDNAFPQPDQLKANPKATLENIQKIKPGMEMTEVKARLGDPAFVNGRDCYYIGVASFGWFAVEGGKVAEVRKVQMNSEPTEKDIANQRRIAYVTAVGAVLILIHLARVVTRRVVLDDQGLRVGGKVIGWEAMRSLDAADYARKGWLNLVYAAGSGTAQVRLDSYHIDLFDDIITEICRRKGFVSPLAPAETDPPA